jgi:hypothetical protein
MKDVIVWQRIEGGLVFVAALALYGPMTPVLPWWAALVVFFAPDLSFFAYGAGTRIGAWVYNLAHVYALGAGLMALGGAVGMPLLTTLGALWLAHSGFDRMLGYGLKAQTSFKDTHLGRLGKAG